MTIILSVLAELADLVVTHSKAAALAPFDPESAHAARHLAYAIGQRLRPARQLLFSPLTLRTHQPFGHGQLTITTTGSTAWSFRRGINQCARSEPLCRM